MDFTSGFISLLTSPDQSSLETKEMKEMVQCSKKKKNRKEKKAESKTNQGDVT